MRHQMQREHAQLMKITNGFFNPISAFIYFFCRTKRDFFFQNLTLGYKKNKNYMTKTLKQIFFFLHQNQIIFFKFINNPQFSALFVRKIVAVMISYGF
jgi:hypothetical protein